MVRVEDPTPTAEDAASILQEALGHETRVVARFPTGLAHYVYEVLTKQGQSLVVRLTRHDQADAFWGAVRWSERLRGLGLPLARVLYADAAGAAHRFPVLILERLPGSDLGLVYRSLSATEKRELAVRMVELQGRVGTLPEGRGFGYAVDESDPRLLPTWRAVLDQHLEHSRARIAAAGLVDPAIVDRVAARLGAHRPALRQVRPVCFLHDTSTKNVLVDRGRLSGIVDVDEVCYGDPLRTVALTRMSLLSTGDDTVYTDVWAALITRSTQRQELLDLYTAMYGVDFIGEIGQTFNRDAPVDASEERAARLLRLVVDFVHG